MQRTLLFTICLSLISVALRAGEPVDYARDVKPILARRCYSCHGVLKQKGGLRLDTGALARTGGEGGPAFEAGNAEESLLIERVTEDDESFRMPPEGKPLTGKEIALLKAWIAQGGKSPANEPPQKDPRSHWAFQVPARPDLPTVKNAAWVRNPVDAFIAAQHEKRGLVPRPTSEKHELLRRISLDLVGLPPTRGELRAFLADTSGDAYEKVVARLLDSPQYGERWGRHWMDVWRYSDWYGRRAVNDVRNSYSRIWRWRDWIVNSLNADKGYDRMVMEMLAADEIAPEDDEAIVATGFIVRNWYSLNYNQWMKDVVEHTGKAFLGLRMNCAHCHDHKYDPIPQEEYFKFRAFFEPLELRQDRSPGDVDPGPFQSYIYASSTAPIKGGLVRIIDDKLDAKTYMYHLGDSRNRMQDRPAMQPAAPAILGGDELKIEPVDLPPVAWYPGLKPFIQASETAQRETALQKAEGQLAKARHSLAAIKSQASPAEAKTLAVAADDVRLNAARLTAARAALLSIKARIAADNVQYKAAGGDAKAASRAAVRAEQLAAICAAHAKLLEAERAAATATNKTLQKTQQQLAAAQKALSAAQQAFEKPAETYSPLSPTYPKKSTGRRRALAQWIANRKNPLTARVAVNHIWMRHFGAPLVETVFDFGAAGKQPSHPQLLDWLAVELMEHGWQMKHLHRLIVTSNTYRMRSDVSDANSGNVARDSDNRYLWRFHSRRMEAETVRDSILHVAGQLDMTLGGPELESELGQTSKRRSLYFSIHAEAGGSMQFMRLFDAPDPCDCYIRSESIVPQQALAMTNSQLSINQSRLLAHKLSQDLIAQLPGRQPNDHDFTAAAFEQILTRQPTADEKTACAEFLAGQTKLFKAANPKQLSGQTAKGDVAPSTDPVMRARESLVRVLFNHNDFVTVR